MNSHFSLFLILIFSIISFQLTSSASFPNPPQFPPPNASAEDWAHFWKLLHNYYAIIARPRFGKRYDIQLKHPSLLEIINSNSVPSSENQINYILGGNNDQEINFDDLYTFTHPDRLRRRRR